MSSAQQEKSIEQQRATMLPKAEREGLQVLAEFQDSAKSGGRIEIRSGFLGMVKFCKERHAQGQPIDTIIVYDSSRFSRTNPIETSAYVHQLMQAGVCRLFTSERTFDFRRAEDRTMFALGGEYTDHKFLQDHSARVTRGLRENAKAQNSNGGVTPFGFDRLVITASGVERGRFGRRDLIVKGRGDKVRLVPTSNTEELDVIKWVFQTFASADRSISGLAAELNEKGIPGPNGRKWGCQGIRTILNNPHCVGDYRYAHVARGSYRRIRDGEIVTADPNSRPELNAKPITAKDAHEGIVSRRLWNAVQGKLQARYKSGRLARRHGYILSGGVLLCGNCGAKMCGGTHYVMHNGRKYSYRRYTCPNAGRGCPYFSIREDRLIRALIRKVQTVYLCPERLEALKSEIRASLREQCSDHAPAKTDAKRKQLATLDSQIKQASRNILLSSPENLAMLGAALDELRRDRSRLAGELAAAERVQAGPKADMESSINKTIAKLVNLRQLLSSADPARLREVLRNLFETVVVFFDVERKRTRRQRWHFSKAIATLRRSAGFAGYDTDALAS
jgi:DNA invertase Pin-like site-specific DNA recombinase